MFHRVWLVQKWEVKKGKKKKHSVLKAKKIFGQAASLSMFYTVAVTKGANPMSPWSPSAAVEKSTVAGQSTCHIRSIPVWEGGVGADFHDSLFIQTNTNPWKILQNTDYWYNLGEM